MQWIWTEWSGEQALGQESQTQWEGCWVRATPSDHNLLFWFVNAPELSDYTVHITGMAAVTWMTLLIVMRTFLNNRYIILYYLFPYINLSGLPSLCVAYYHVSHCNLIHATELQNNTLIDSTFSFWLCLNSPSTSWITPWCPCTRRGTQRVGHLPGGTSLHQTALPLRLTPPLRVLVPRCLQGAGS